MIKYFIFTFMVIAGVFHFMATPERLAANSLLGLFFVALGILQVTYASLCIRKPTQKILLFGILFNTGLLALWLLTQLLPGLAGSSREPLQVLSGTRKLLELISVELLLVHYKHLGKINTANSVPQPQTSTME